MAKSVGICDAGGDDDGAFDGSVTEADDVLDAADAADIADVAGGSLYSTIQCPLWGWSLQKWSLFPLSSVNRVSWMVSQYIQADFALL